MVFTIHGLIRGVILFSGLTIPGTTHGLGGIEPIVLTTIHLMLITAIIITKVCIEIMLEEVRFINIIVTPAVQVTETTLTTETLIQEAEG